MKAELNEMLENERIKVSILSKAKTTQIMLTASYQFNSDLFARACERLDDVFDYILEQMQDEHAE